jgi:hypothetical protein
VGLRSSWKGDKSAKIGRVKPQLKPAERQMPKDDAIESDSWGQRQEKGALNSLEIHRVRSKPSSRVMTLLI